MLFPTNNLISTEEAQQNFSKITRIVDECGCVILYQDNIPRYLLTELGQEEFTFAEEEELDRISAHLIRQNQQSYEVLAQ